ncbi:STM4015 family protein [Planomonospora sp. ID82291]|uniref:STM4015 family protein n=1 Tax=Planomonospora sp. ID82291 TaxID=2738136 RepID=UPI0018C3E9A9|nr:STM4015 family protein [Planomonospora sp. ID82291]MBG0817624.1 STM4015 family protein [Planomonospora sp. ID82291]
MARGGLRRFGTLPLEGFPCLADEDLDLDEDLGDGEGEPLPRAQAWSLWLNEQYDHEESFEDYFARFLADADTTVVRELVFKMWGDPAASSEQAVRLLTEAADRFPALRAIVLGDIPPDECEISWIHQSDLTPLLEAFPELEVLEVRGGNGLRLRPVRHERLKVLRFESGGLPAGVVRAVGACEFPALEHLELWLGVSDYGGDATVADLEGVLSGDRLPALRHLGLQDSEIQDEVAAAVASAPVVARLESLALSMGTLSDAGAEALLAGQPLGHLKTLDLRHHYVGAPMAQRLAGALPETTTLLMGAAREPYAFDPDGRYVAVAE